MMRINSQCTLRMAAYLLESGLTTTNCNADIFRFPFDQHSCTFELVSILSENHLVMDIGYLQFVFPSDTNKQWKIVYISKKRSKHTFSSKFINSMAVFTIHFERKPTFLVLNILIPVIGLGLVNPLVCSTRVIRRKSVTFGHAFAGFDLFPKFGF